MVKSKLEGAGIEEYRRSHLPYVIGVMRAHKKLCDQGPYAGDPDMLNAVFVGSIMAGRMLLQFMGIGMDRGKGELKRYECESDDVSVKDVGGELADIGLLNADEGRKSLLVGFIKMAHKAGAHMTVPDKRPWERSHEAFEEIEALLEQQLTKS